MNIPKHTDFDMMVKVVFTLRAGILKIQKRAKEGMESGGAVDKLNSADIYFGAIEGICEQLLKEPIAPTSPLKAPISERPMDL